MSAAAAILLYNLALASIGLLGLPLAVLWVLRSPRLRRGFTTRLRPLEPSSVPTLWVHAASVGEVEAAVPLILALRERGVTLRVTSLSDTGLTRLRSHFPDLTPRFAPLDLPGLAQASVRRARVAALILVETELWPNTIYAVHRRRGVVMIASARISDRSLPRYRRLRFLLAPLLAKIDAVAARSDVDRQRFLELGCAPDRVQVVGDVKLARAAPAPASDRLRAAIGEGPILLGGSTHPGEEAALLDVYTELRREISRLRLVLAPRHPERAGEVAELARARGYEVRRRSEGAAHADVVVIDSLGELGSLYGLADLVFGGGTLAPVGGHNLFEPIFGERAVVVGPHTQNQAGQVELLEPTGALIRIDDATQLAGALRKLWHDPDRNRAAARRARALVERDADVVERMVEWLETLRVVPRERG